MSREPYKSYYFETELKEIVEFKRRVTSIGLMIGIEIKITPNSTIKIFLYNFDE